MHCSSAIVGPGEIFSATYQTATEEQHRDRNVFEVFETPRAVGTAQVLKENIGAAVKEDQEALCEFGCRDPALGVC